MRTRNILAASLVVVAAAGSLSPAVAKGKPKAKPKPIVVQYTAGPLTVDPTTSGTVRDTCDVVNPTARDRHPFKVPAAGVLKVDMVQTGDWAIAVRDKDGSTIGKSDGAGPLDVESVELPFKKGEEVLVDTCNFAGAPTAKITLKFTYK